MENYGNVPQKNTSVVSIGDWIVTMIVMMIPLVNFIMLLVWAFSSSTAESKANWAKASLIFMVVGVVISIIFGSAILAAIASIGS